MVCGLSFYFAVFICSAICFPKFLKVFSFLPLGEKRTPSLPITLKFRPFNVLSSHCRALGVRLQEANMAPVLPFKASRTSGLFKKFFIFLLAVNP